MWSLCTNVTTIESWEIERHKSLLRRSRTHGGYGDAPDGVRVRIVRQEFPYDIGFWKNITQGMCGGPLTWLWPFARIYPLEDGLSFKVNGFEGNNTMYDHEVQKLKLTSSTDASLTWPPPDPDRINRKSTFSRSTAAFIHSHEATTNQQFQEAFRKRQTYDFERRLVGNLSTSRGLSHHERQADTNIQPEEDQAPAMASTAKQGREAWRNSEGERLDDFGVDEHAEFYDEDDVPLAELLSRRRARGLRENQ